MSSQVHVFGAFRFDPAQRTLTRNGEAVAAMPKVLDLLDALVRAGGRVLTKEELMREVWPDTHVDEGSLTRTMSRLREIVGPDGPIETIPKRGYRFAAETRVESPVSETQTIAVLPFVWMTKPPDDLQFLDIAMADCLITQISRLNNVEVRPTSAIASLRRGENLDVQARSLRVHAIVDGRIQLSGSRVRVTVQLLAQGAERPSWAETFDFSTDGLFALQDAIARSLIAVLSPRKSLPASYVPDRRAYQLFLRGRYLTNAYTREALLQAIEALTDAATIDPYFAEAHAALAMAYLIAGGSSLFPLPAFTKARDAAATALRIDPTIVEAHLANASLRLWLDHDVKDAYEMVQRALMLGPNQSLAHHVHAWHLMAQRRFAEAESAMARAREIDPTSAPIAVDSGLPAYLASDTKRAIELFGKAAESHPQFWYAHTFLGLAMLSEDEARKGFELTGGAVPESATAYACVLARNGRQADAASLLAETRDRVAGYLSPFEIATVMVALGDVDGALRSLKRALDESDKWLMWIATDPRLNELRGRPEFDEIVRAAGFGA